MKNRIEEDFLGKKEIPENAYWGIHTARAFENFPFEGPKVSGELIHAMADVKRACVETNRELGFIASDLALSISEACIEIASDKWNDQFILSALQGGAGTSLNMNINEVIANRALELTGKRKGDYQTVHPLNHINLHQSTNDVYPTALKIAVIRGLRVLSEEIAQLQGAFQLKEKEFSNVVISGKTELQDAVPITLGGQFASFAEALSRDRWRTFKSEERIRVVNLGGTAVGTGLTAPRDYIFRVIEKLREITGLGLTRADFVMDQTANADVFAEVSGMLAANAGNLVKICMDLRLMHYLREIQLPSVQAGSSIMPGKVNPVILESCISAALTAESKDQLLKRCVSMGSFQINEWMPLIADSIMTSLRCLSTANHILSRHVQEITLSQDAPDIFNNPILMTVFLPLIGYEKASEWIKIYQTNRSEYNNFREFLISRFGEEKVKNLLSPENLMSLGYKNNE